ncbi:hypothetical protein BRETT_004455 [Brettanomyces bruxellensis]|uniref:Postreplication repair E3 ubiquitin-protein ligase RAD18 n=1 Tax=Dekkera bruxellensis TaxID=5007 RepID=A0A871R3A6_DEKBR|nr:uncharacterized protein BRETT_004455 [Brettanomyces bruxellensis]QOU19234.1 hypothetical protein BRETT_004455 [Brettanomyces bruxellensis]
MSLIKDSKISVEDPSDWSGTMMPSVSTLDSMLRCQICKGFLRAPVVTSCGHIFCSICIREALTTKGKCPLCQEEIFESGLRKVLLLDGVVDCNLKKAEVISDSQEESSERVLPSGKSSNVIDLTKDSSFNIAASNYGKSTVEQQTLDISHISKRSTQQVYTASTHETSPDADMLVQCPVCSKYMTIEKLQGSHIDKCLSGQSDKDHKPQSSPRKGSNKGTGLHLRSDFEISRLLHSKKRKHENGSFQLQPEIQKKKQRIPNLDVMIPTNRLREKLNLYGLSTGGPRQKLEARMKQYINLYNANLDALHPVDDRVLIGRLSRWESLVEISERQDDKARDNGKSNSTEAIQNAKQNAHSWKVKYRSSYKELIERAKASVTKLSKDGAADNNTLSAEKGGDEEAKREA